MSASADDVMMRTALAAAQSAAEAGEVPVGAAVARAGELISVGRNETISHSDATAHAEIQALRAAGKAVGNHRLTSATLYVTLEPCAMCVGAIVQARVARVVFGAYDAKAGALGSVIDLSDSAAFNHRFEVQGGVLEQDGAKLLQEFFATRR